MKNTTKSWVLSLLCVCFLAIFTGCVNFVVGGMTATIFDTFAPQYTAQKEATTPQQREIKNLSIKYTAFNKFTLALIVPLYVTESISFEIHNLTDNDLLKLRTALREPGPISKNFYDYDSSATFDTFQYHPSGTSLPKRISEMKEPILYVNFWGGEAEKALHEILSRLVIPLSAVSAKTYEKAFGTPPTNS